MEAIAQSHQGQISVKNDSSGTNFTIRLPLYQNSKK